MINEEIIKENVDMGWHMELVIIVMSIHISKSLVLNERRDRGLVTLKTLWMLVSDEEIDVNEPCDRSM